MNSHGIIGKSEAIKEVLAMIDQVSRTDITVLITGESGSGKELVAQAIHHKSLRKNNAFTIVNCGAIPAGTIESELFGYMKGAFSGSLADKQGKIEIENNGNLFIDEIGEIKPDGNPRIILQYDARADSLQPRKNIVSALLRKKSTLYENIKLYTGMTDKELIKDHDTKVRILRYLVDKEIESVDGVGRIMAEFYTDPENLMKYVNANKDFPLD